jgi:hypothetical protein
LKIEIQLKYSIISGAGKNYLIKDYECRGFLTERRGEYVSNVSVILPQPLEARYLYYNYVHLFVLHDYFYLSACVLHDTSYGAIYNAQS